MLFTTLMCTFVLIIAGNLLIYLDHVESSEAKALLETFYSPVFQIFYDTFTSTESTLKQKSKILLLFFVIN